MDSEENINRSKVDEKRAKWIQFMKDQKMEMSRDEADQLLKNGVSAFFDLEMAGGFFDTNPEDPRIVLITDEGYFLRDRKYLIRSQDEIFVNWLELMDLEILSGEKSLPNFGDFFTTEKM